MSEKSVTDLFFFRQKIADSGYKVITPRAVAGEDGRLTGHNKVPEPSVIADDYFGWHTDTHYSSLDDGLFLDFATLSLTSEAVLGFANKSGLLGVEDSIISDEYVADGSRNWIVSVNKELKVNHYLVSAEPLSRWYSEITQMARMVELWQLLARSKMVELNRLFKWEETKSGVRVIYEHEVNGSRFRTLVYSESYRPHLLEIGGLKNVRFALLVVVQETINKIYREHASPLMIFEDGHKKLIHQIVPQNLLGFLWQQFARAFEGEKPYQNCKQCNKPFTSPKSRGNQRQYCSDACKSKSYRDRRASS